MKIVRPNHFILMEYLITGRGGRFKQTPWTPSGSATAIQTITKHICDKYDYLMLALLVRDKIIILARQEVA